MVQNSSLSGSRDRFRQIEMTGFEPGDCQFESVHIALVGRGELRLTGTVESLSTKGATVRTEDGREVEVSYARMTALRLVDSPPPKAKGTAFDKGLRTPAILSWGGNDEEGSGIAGGRSFDELVGAVDFYATLDFDLERAELLAEEFKRMFNDFVDPKFDANFLLWPGNIEKRLKEFGDTPDLFRDHFGSAPIFWVFE